MSIARRLAALFGTSDPDVIAWLKAGVANGGFYTALDVAMATAFVAADKASGAFYLTDDYRVHCVASQVLAMTSLKKRVLATAFGSPVHTAYRDVTTNGLSSYLNTNFTPSTDAAAMTKDSVHVEVFERTNVSGNGVAIGGTSGSNRSIAMQTRNGGNALCDSNSAFGVFTLPAATSVGLTQSGRSGPLATDAYAAKDGVDMVRTTTPSGLGASLPAHALFIGAFNNQGTAANLRGSSYLGGAYGAALSGAQRLARANAWLAWARGVGAA